MGKDLKKEEFKIKMKKKKKNLGEMWAHNEAHTSRYKRKVLRVINNLFLNSSSSHLQQT